MRDERRLRAELPVYVGSFNQPSYVRQMVVTLRANGFGNIVIADNASTSPKTRTLLAELEALAGVRVWHLGENIGPLKTVQRIKAREPGAFVFTDPDLELSPTLPEVFLERLFAVSRRYRSRKVGLALEIPAADEARDLRFSHPDLGDFTVQEWERRFWEDELEPGIFRANVDTTFFLWNPVIRVDLRRDYARLRALFRPRRLGRRLPYFRHIDIRVARPGFVARHLPWYKDDRFPEDEREFYIRSATRASTWLRDSA
jgi:hypothetical protein